ncbi:MAG TPA: ATP-grasp domain-containing protein [Vicinamibacteria bacterium]|jgi:D-alanine-D-alanine ligase|nr:ATP-grasp domain-containing protein [Vicinamibacteria bacterium]
MQESLVPPDEVKGVDLEGAEWKMEYDVVSTLRGLGHEVQPLGVGGNLADIRNAIADFKPHITFNLLEGFDDVATWDQNVVAYLELLKVPYTGCNSRGLLLGRDKAIAKKLLSYHRIPVADFVVAPRGRRFRRPKRLAFPLFVKSLTLDASIGISQASVVEDEAKLEERVNFVHESIGTDALVEHYIEGRELYVGVLGNERLQVLPIWELYFKNLPEEVRKIATERLKWSLSYQKKHGIDSGEAKDLPPGLEDRIRDVCKRVYRNLMLSGCARIDLRMTEAGQAYVVEANPNPQLAHDEDFAQSARKAGIDYPELIQRILNLGLRWEPSRLG